MNWLLSLQQAGLPAISAFVNEAGKVEAAFSRGLTAQEWLLFLSLTDQPAYRKLNAKAEAKLATQLRTLTPQQAVDYIENNVTTLATAKSAMKIMVRMLIAMRDEVWPVLPDE